MVRVVKVNTSPELYKDAHLPRAIFWNIFSNLLKPNLSMNLELTEELKNCYRVQGFLVTQQ